MATLVLMLGCKGAEATKTEPETGFDGDLPVLVGGSGAFACDVPELFIQRCNGETCHGVGVSSTSALDLISPNVEARVSGVAGTNCSGLLADSTQPQASLLYTKVTEPDCGVRMPMGSQPLEADEVTCLEYWISGLLPPDPGCVDCECEPGTVEDCYSGPASTLNIGMCKGGTHTCQTSGLDWSECEGEVTPLGENCFTPDVDEDCDGQMPACGEVWGRRFGDPDDQAIRSVAVDPSTGDVYSFGDFEGVVSFGAAPLTAEPSDPLRQDLVVSKHDLHGNHIWSRRFGDSSTQIAQKMAIDSDGNLVFVGRMYGTIDLGGGTLHAAGGNDIIVFKLDSEGNHIWSQIFGDNEPDRAARLAFDADDNVILTGTFTGKIDFGVAKLVSAGERDAFVMKLARDTGEPTFAMKIGGAGDDYGFGVDVDQNGDVVIGGRFGAALELGGQTLSHAGDLDIYVARLDEAGKVLWAQSFGGSGPDELHDLRLQQNGDIVLLGAISASVDFGGDTLDSAGARDIFLATLDGQGEHVWSERYGDEADQFELGGTESWLTLAFDANGDIHVGGSLYGVLDFGDGDTLAAKGDRPDVFHAQFSANGEYRGGWRFGDSGSDFGHDIAVAASGHVIHGGRSLGPTVDFGDIGVFENAGRSDGLLARLAPL